ncbi:uncharacterized protein BJ171DRAFT_437592 [Polychytrium aggregatum]|uniref:uncharacterized protein n=1 Tax=Polychytrium aggregatum TaxID=110093 RepID=UPI0022FF1770|nr:uncharacterized protein BJ171DRAFT_437592 [Polychytrium aggregatum]KAI9208872.1 hypothetical protein BJ171DRAFT_437592 [Polychytrium aggregatum]
MLPPLFIVAALLALGARAFYLPGVAPHDYAESELVPLLVNAVSSTETALPFDYYYNQFHFCKPKGDPVAQPESLGSILFGDRLYDSSFELYMNKNTSCNTLCSQSVPKEDAAFINSRIREKYTVHWVVDGLPVAMSRLNQSTNELIYNMGFNLGFISKDGSRTYLNNHYEIQVHYHLDEGKKSPRKFRVVGVTVYPHSVLKIDQKNNCVIQPGTPPLTLSETGDNLITFTYNVYWIRSGISWTTRWDTYLKVTDPKIHWFSLTNSIVIVLFLSGMVGVIMLRALNRDITRYNQLDIEDDIHEDFGWKLVHGDVFRSPIHGQFLAVAVGGGAQLFLMTAVTLVFAVLGFLSPSSRGSLSTVILVLYVCFGSVSGYHSARLYKMFGGQNWKKNVLLSAFLLPGVVFLVFLTLNFFLIAAKSSSAVPFGTIFALLSMWCLVSVPLCFIGAYFGFKKPRIEHPVRTNQIPRQIPEQPLYLRTLPSVLMGGVLPFGAIFIELYFIMNSIWYHKVYYVFGFLALVFVILVVTCAEVAILLCYFHLCAENYHWWWRSFFTSGSSALYVFLYCTYYYATRLNISNSTSTVLYFGWSAVVSALFFILTGSIGFYACFMFVRKVYSLIKID